MLKKKKKKREPYYYSLFSVLEVEIKRQNWFFLIRVIKLLGGSES